MQRLFFHNQHDKESREILETLKDDVKVYDVFGADRYSLPEGIRLTALPYMVDKYIDFKPAGPYAATVPFVLEFNCMDYLDQPASDEVGVFRVLINGRPYDLIPEKGVIQIEFTCPEATVINIQIEGPGYLPFEAEVVVVA